MNLELIFSIALGVILGGIGLMYLPKILSSIVWFFVNIFPLLCGFGFLYFLYYSGTLSLRAMVTMCAIYGLFVVVSLIYGGYRYFRSDIDKNQDASNLRNFFTWVPLPLYLLLIVIEYFKLGHNYDKDSLWLLIAVLTLPALASGGLIFNRLISFFNR
ncbi:MAG: hypothetical protein P8N01_07290 [Burkholderiales bacterium]|nr:hypothetical protein [Burkholderiales bacterium]